MIIFSTQCGLLLFLSFLLVFHDDRKKNRMFKIYSNRPFPFLNKFRNRLKFEWNVRILVMSSMSSQLIMGNWFISITFCDKRVCIFWDFKKKRVFCCTFVWNSALEPSWTVKLWFKIICYLLSKMWKSRESNVNVYSTPHSFEINRLTLSSSNVINIRNIWQEFDVTLCNFLIIIFQSMHILPAEIKPIWMGYTNQSFQAIQIILRISYTWKNSYLLKQFILYQNIILVLYYHHSITIFDEKEMK